MANHEPSGTTPPWPRRVDSLAKRSTSVASSSSRGDDADVARSSSRKWRPSWLSRGASRDSRTTGPSRRTSTSTTSSSTVSGSTLSSTCTDHSGLFDIYRLPETNSEVSSNESEGESHFSNVTDATLALASLANTGLDNDSKSKRVGRETPAPPQQSLPPHMRRSESRAGSTSSNRSAKPRDNPSEYAEIEMVAREYQGYWRPSFTGKLPPATAICGSMLLTARMPARKSDSSDIVVDTDLKEQAHSLCNTLEHSEDPDAALQALRSHSLETAIVALKTSLDAAQIPIVPEKPAWQMYQKVAQAKNKPEKLPDLWGNVSKLLKKVPQETMVVIMFLLSIARRLQSRGLTVAGQSTAVFLLRGLWPRYLGDDVSKLLMLHYDDIPHDLPLILESVNYRFSGRRCNLLALVANRKGSPEQGVRGVQEIRASEDQHMEW